MTSRPPFLTTVPPFFGPVRTALRRTTAVRPRRTWLESPSLCRAYTWVEGREGVGRRYVTHTGTHTTHRWCRDDYRRARVVSSVEQRAASSRRYRSAVSDDRLHSPPLPVSCWQLRVVRVGKHAPHVYASIRARAHARTHTATRIREHARSFGLSLPARS